MGEAKTRHKQLRQMPCVYCGTEPAGSVDHVPPRAAFDASVRPDDLVVPACIECNRGSTAADSIISWIARFFPSHEGNPTVSSDFEKLSQQVKRFYPEVFTSLSGPPPQRFVVRRSGLIAPPEAVRIRLEGPYIDAAVRQFGLKFALAMHWLRTKRVAPQTSRVSVWWFTNYQKMVGEVPDIIFRMFPKPQELMQGQFGSGDQFRYTTAVAEDDDTVSACMCGFRLSLIIVAIVAETGRPGDDAHRVLTPSDVRKPYPYDLPRLSEADLRARARISAQYPA